MSYTIDNILYASDLGPRSVEVFEHAVGIALRFGAKLHVVTVSRSTSELMLSEHMTPEQLASFNAQRTERARDDFQGRIDTFCKEHPDLDVCSVVANVQVLEGNASSAISKLAKTIPAQLIVLGSHGHNSVGQMLIGSVAHKVTVGSKVPVVLVPINR